jgi:hypothetical protein
LFPDINTLFTIDLYSHFRAHRCADSATVALLFFVYADRTIALGIIFRCWHNMTFRAKMNTQKAFFTNFFINLN